MKQTDEMKQLKNYCQQHMNQPVHLQTHDQQGFSGILQYVDDDHVYLLVPVDENGMNIDIAQLLMEEQANQPMMRQDERYPYYYPYYPYGYGYGYGGYGGFGYPRPRPYGWNQLVLPLAALTALAVIA